MFKTVYTLLFTVCLLGLLAIACNDDGPSLGELGQVCREETPFFTACDAGLVCERGVCLLDESADGDADGDGDFDDACSGDNCEGGEGDTCRGWVEPCDPTCGADQYCDDGTCRDVIDCEQECDPYSEYCDVTRGECTRIPDSTDEMIEPCDDGLTCVDGVCRRTVHFSATVYDFNTNSELSDVTVVLLDNETGKPLGIQKARSNSFGQVAFDVPLPDGVAAEAYQIAALCEGIEGVAIDTYQYNLPAQSDGARLWLVDTTTYYVAPQAAGLTLDESKTVVAGGVYWTDPDGHNDIVGCSVVSTDTGTGEVRYFSDNTLPASLEVRDSINPLNGFFIIANIAPGPVTLQAFGEGDTLLGTSRLVAKPASICIANIYAGGSENPAVCDISGL